MNTDEPIISVIIPCFNKEDFIRETLDSVLSQTYLKAIKEIIVIDDGSTDNSASLVKEKAISFPLIKYLYQPNAGVSAARNTGIICANGKYLAFLDADDLWQPDKIERQYKALKQYPHVGLFYTDLFKYDYKTETLTPVKVISYKENETELLFKFVAKGAPVIPSTVLVKKICFEQVGLFDVLLVNGGEDIDMWLRIARQYSFHHIDGCLIKKRELKGSLGANTFENAKGYKIALDKMQQLEPAIAVYRQKRDALIHYKVGLYFYKKGENMRAIDEVQRSFKKDFKLLKAYVLWFAIVFKKVSGLDIFPLVK
jgi:glycosyltransferase involved in cell wall biosynthesis